MTSNLYQNKYLFVVLFVASLPFFQYYIVWNGGNALLYYIHTLKSTNLQNQSINSISEIKINGSIDSIHNLRVASGKMLEDPVALTATNNLNYDGNDGEICEQDFVNSGGSVICRPRCKRGFFNIRHMKDCHPWLSCIDLRRDITIGKRIGGGNIKRLYMAKWLGKYTLIINRGNSAFMRSYFVPGINSLIEMQPSAHVTQYIGHCHNYLFTEYHPLGDLSNLDDILTYQYRHLDSIQTRLGLCVDYSAVLTYLADPLNVTGTGAKVMCDTSSLAKLIHQYLITNSFRLIVNDVDSLPKVSDQKNLIGSSNMGRKGKDINDAFGLAQRPRVLKCGKKPKLGIFSAPEQRWKPGIPFKKTKNIFYDEKVDVWKIPDVCNYIIGNKEGSATMKNLLKDLIHYKCKITDPKERPSALTVYQTYQEIYKRLYDA